jgi:hypothetical protein
MREPLRRILFLDIDGVVLPLSQMTRRRYEDYGEGQIPLPLGRLVTLLDEHPQIELVLSSSWRLDVGIERARDLLPERHRAKLIGETPAVGNGNDRGAECLQWLAVQPADCLFAAVDDCRQLYAVGVAWLVLVNAREGIDDTSIQIIKRLLRVPAANCGG